MKYIIGGLLVVSLMSAPAQLVSDSGDGRERNTAVVYMLNKPYGRQIHAALSGIAEDTRKMTARLAEKNRAVADVYSTMDQLAKNRARLAQSQMDQFAAFVGVCNTHGAALQTALRGLDERKSLTEVKSELLHSNADYAFIYNELHEIQTTQQAALTSLDAILTAASGCLDALTVC